MNSLGLYPIPGSDEMPLTDIEVAVKENYHVSNQTGHNLVHVSYPLCTCAKRLSFVHLSVWLVKIFNKTQHIYWVRQLRYKRFTCQSINITRVYLRDH